MKTREDVHKAEKLYWKIIEIDRALAILQTAREKNFDIFVGDVTVFKNEHGGLQVCVNIVRELVDCWHTRRRETVRELENLGFKE